MSPPTDSRERILLAAEELFAARGFDGVTVREICERAGMNGAAVNYHFGDKESLYVDTVSNAHATGHCHAAEVAGGSAAERLRVAVGQMVAEMLAPLRPSALQLLMRELGHPSAATRAVVESFIRPSAERLAAVIAELIPGAPPQRRRMVCYSIVGQCLFYRQNRAVIELLHGPPALDGVSPGVVADHVARFTLAALGLAEPITGNS